MAKIAGATDTGAAMAAALYSMMFAPLGAQLGPTGGLLVDAAAHACATAKNDPLAQRFAQLLAQATKDNSSC